MTEVKFCGMTREEDVRHAVRLGAAFVGVIMTESRRRVAPERAAELCASIDGTTVKRVGVFGNEPVALIMDAALAAGIDVVQVHAEAMPDADDVKQLRETLGVEVWRVIRIGPGGATADRHAAFQDVDGVLVDTLVRGALGGSGIPFDWDAVGDRLRDRPAGPRFIVAGGLRPENVGRAIGRLSPDVVDVSSGVESAPGVKDHLRMAAFMAAVRRATSAPVR